MRLTIKYERERERYVLLAGHPSAIQVIHPELESPGALVHTPDGLAMPSELMYAVIHADSPYISELDTYKTISVADNYSETVGALFKKADSILERVIAAGPNVTPALESEKLYFSSECNDVLDDLVKNW